MKNYQNIFYNLENKIIKSEVFVIETMEFISQYDKVFENDVVTNCGREECKKLIYLARVVGKDFCDDYGNEYTGMMNIENIQKLRNHILLYI